MKDFFIDFSILRKMLRYIIYIYQTHTPKPKPHTNFTSVQAFSWYIKH